MTGNMSGPVRLIDVARVAGVSKVTVSKVLHPSAGNNTRVSEATAAKVRAAAETLGYRPNLAARQLAGGWSRLIGVLIDAESSPGELLRVSYAERAAGENGYRFVVGQCRSNLENIRAYLDDFAARGTDGVIIHSNAFSEFNGEIIAYAQRLRHVIYYDRPVCDDGTLDFVHISFENGVRQLVDHLCGRGRRRIAYFAPGVRHSFGKWASQLEREHGFRSGMEAHGLPCPAEFFDGLLFDKMPEVPELTAIAMEFLKKHRPDAVIARNDDVAAVMLRAVHKLGMRCPDDVAVAGYDNLKFSEYLEPSLTTVDNRLPELSRLVVESLIARIEGKHSGAEPIRLHRNPLLIVREST